MTDKFEFDQRKSTSNKLKHGLDFAEALVLWNGYVQEEPANAVGSENRYLNVGKIGDKYWTAVVTYRDDVCRIISVHRSHQRDIRNYERSSPKI